MNGNGGFTAPTIEWVYLIPLLVVLGAGVIGVLIEAFVPAKVRRTTQVVLSLVALVGALAAEVVLWNKPAVHATSGMPVNSEELGQGTLPFKALGGVSVFSSTNAESQVHSVYVADPLAIAVQAIILVLAIVAIFVIAAKVRGQDAFAPTAAAVPGSAYEELARRKGLEQTEAFPLVLFAVGGMMVFAATENLLVMFVALEVLSLPLYVLTAMARRRRLLAQEASFKYFLLGAFASALFLFGTALIYGFSGSVSLNKIVETVFNGSLLDAADGAKILTDTGKTSFTQAQSLYPLLIVGILLILVGLLFKIGAAPFHTWTPDVYQGAPTPITGFMAACTKAAAFAALLRVLFLVSTPMAVAMRDHLWVALWIVAILTMVIGTIVAVVQTDMKRMLAYSSIAHAGFILVGVIGFAPGDFFTPIVKSMTGQAPAPHELTADKALEHASNAFTAPTSATVFYLLAYGLATVGAFAVVTLVRERAAVTASVAEPAARPAKAKVAAAVGAGSSGGSAKSRGATGSGTSEATVDDTSGATGRVKVPHDVVVLGEATHLSQWAGLGRRSPWLAAAFSVFLLSMAGIPLTAGFVAKFGAFRAAVEGGAWPLALVGVLASAVAVFFYVRIIVLMYFTPPQPDEDGRPGVVVVRSAWTAVAITICAVGIILLGLFPSWALDLANQAATFAL